MGIKKIIIVTGLFLIACTHPEAKSDLSDKDFFITSPIELGFAYMRADGSTAHTNFKAPKIKMEKDDISIEIYKLETCPALGVDDQTSIISTPAGKWGKVTPIEKLDGSDIEDKNEVCEKKSEGIVSFAFCAEKIGKAVAICIKQVTNNESVPNEVFESFRWTE